MESDPYGTNFQARAGRRRHAPSPAARHRAAPRASFCAWQAMLQGETHAERLDVFTAILEKERARLGARATLQSLFKK